MSESGPELGVVCRNCGSEVSPYVTECPYCGERVRKRAPKLERTGEGLTPKPPRFRRPRRRRRDLRELDRPWATIVLLAAPALAMIVMRAGGLSMADLGALAGPPGDEPWRLVTASFVHDDIGYLFAAGLAIAIVAPALERRVGTVATLVLAIAGGGLAIAAAAGAGELGFEDPVFAAGANGMALFLAAMLGAMMRAEAAGDPDADWDPVGLMVIVLVLLALPIVEEWASPAAGIAGGLAGYLAGTLAPRGAPR